MNLSSRQKKQWYFLLLCRSVTFIAVATLGILLFHIMKEGFEWLDIDFLNNFPSRFPEKAGIKSALYGSIWLITMTAVISAPLGIATAFYLEEYAPKKSYMRWIQINISNLAGMPSIVYGLLGLAIFVRYFGLEDSLWSGALTLSLLILPVIIIASQEAIRAVPDSIRYAAYSLGARRWQVILGQILPTSLPGIMTGLILAISRAIGESAPMIMIGALSYVAFIPEVPSDPFTVLPVQIYNWAGRPQAEFHGLAGAGIIVLLVVLFTMNFGAVLIRQRFQRYKK
ncbi:MAG: phosphate ABC transporter permease PstA [Nitrospinales bacterium]